MVMDVYINDNIQLLQCYCNAITTHTTDHF